MAGKALPNKFEAVTQENSSFIHASRGKEETSTFGSRYCKYDFVQLDKVILLPNKTTLEYTSPKHSLDPFVYNSFSKNENLCIFNCLKLYICKRNKSQHRVMIT